MYGMLLESIQHFIQIESGEEAWLSVTSAAGCEYTVFNTFHIYPDHLIGDLALAASKVLRRFSYNGYMRHFGRCFVKFFSNFGYEEVIKATGKNFTDFLDNVDNIHVQMQFTYPHMDSPSIYVTEVDQNGSVLIYRSFRAGFKEYFLGQLLEIADSLFNIKCDIQLLEECTSKGPIQSVQLKLRLNYDNRNYMMVREQQAAISWDLPPLSTSFLLDLFPYGLVFGPALRILDAGSKLRNVFPERRIVSSPLTSFFRIRRPKAFQLDWKNVTSCQSVSFELELIGSAVVKKASRNILLTGQMKLLEPVSVVVYLCSPAVRNISDLKDMGMFLDDLNDIGLGRDLVVKGWKHSKRVEELREKTGRQCAELEANYISMKTWKEEGDRLLYSMLPRSVAEQLKAGISPLQTCKDFEQVTIMFAEVCGLSFTDSMEDLMQVVEEMNRLFSKFDKITDEFDVYKVETVGEVYMAVSGAPEASLDHAGNVARLSLRLVREVAEENTAIHIRIGAHSGEVVAGVVGTKLPRYCLFGDTVNTASRMQSTSLEHVKASASLALNSQELDKDISTQIWSHPTSSLSSTFSVQTAPDNIFPMFLMSMNKPGRIQISSSTKELLERASFLMEPRGKIQIKGKGEMETFWLIGINEKLF